jgi:hypothetical protein
VRPGKAERLSGLREDLRALIAGSVDGLQTQDVTFVIDEVATSVPPVPVPGSPVTKLRILVAVMGAALCLLAILFVIVVIRLKTVAARQISPQSSRPTISAARKPSAA